MSYGPVHDKASSFFDYITTILGLLLQAAVPGFMAACVAERELRIFDIAHC